MISLCIFQLNKYFILRSVFVQCDEGILQGSFKLNEYDEKMDIWYISGGGESILGRFIWWKSSVNCQEKFSNELLFLVAFCLSWSPKGHRNRRKSVANRLIDRLWVDIDDTKL